MDHEDTYDAGRYDSARGWEPSDKNNKIREAHRKQNPELYGDDSMLETKSANERVREGSATNIRAQLFGSLWRTGELAVLFAESGTGKSILATQIAESIATGVQASLLASDPASASLCPTIRTPQSALRNRNVIYLDFQLSDAQFAQRYSCPSPVPGKLPVKYRFSKNHRRTGYGDTTIPTAFKGDITRYFRHSLEREFDRADAKIIIIDNLACLHPRATGPAAAIRRMRSLKLYSMTTGASILVLASAKCRSSPPYKGGVAALRGRGGYLRPLSLADLAPTPEIADSADSVFAIGRSNFGPDIRYIKHLKSTSSEIIHNESNVLTYRLERVSSPHVSKGSTPATENIESTEIATLKLPASPRPTIPASLLSPVSSLPSPVSEGPFLGFTYLGPSTESDHLRDHEAEYRAAEAQELKRLKNARTTSAREALVQGIINGSYERYLQR